MTCKSCGRPITEADLVESSREGMCVACGDECDDIDREEAFFDSGPFDDD